MKAIILTNYGPPEVLQLREVPTPLPKDNELRIRIRATTVTMGDSELRRMQFPIWLALPLRLLVRFTMPRDARIPGTEFAGEIDQIGKHVTRFRSGDQVYGSSLLGFGAYAQYKCLPETGSIAIKPKNMSFEEAATVPFGGGDALHFLRQANLKAGQKILIVGACGTIGSFGVLLAKQSGAIVTAVDAPGKLDVLRSIGADRVIDYTKDDYTKGGETYDVIFDAVGKSPFDACMRILKAHGYYLLANPSVSDRIRQAIRGKAGDKHVFSQAATRSVDDLNRLREMIEAGQLKPVIDRSYTLEQIVEAHRYVDSGAKKGNVVVKIE